MQLIQSFGRRAAVIALALVISGGVFSNIASADEVVSTDSEVELVGVTNVCYNVSTVTANPVELQWDGANLTWPTQVSGSSYVAVGTITVKMQASGDPGNRTCGWVNENVSDFVNGAGHVLLPNTALRNGLYPIKGNTSNAAGVQVPLGAPGGGLTHASNTYSQWWGIGVNIAGIDVDAPAGTYKSTVTVTVSPPAP